MSTEKHDNQSSIHLRLIDTIRGRLGHDATPNFMARFYYLIFMDSRNIKYYHDKSHMSFKNFLDHAEQTYTDELTKAVVRDLRSFNIDDDLFSKLLTLISDIDRDHINRILLDTLSRALYEVRGHRGKWFTPEFLDPLVSYYLEQVVGDNVAYIGTGNATFLPYYSNNISSYTYSNVSVDPESAMITRIINSISGVEYNPISDDILLHNFIDNQNLYDKIFCMPPIGIRFRSPFDLAHLMAATKQQLNFEIKRPISSEWVYCLASMLKMKPNARMALVISASAGYKSVDRDVREMLVESGRVSKIISLPKSPLITSQIGAQLVIIDGTQKISNGIEFIDLNIDSINGNIINNVDSFISPIENPVHSVTVSAEKLRENNYVFMPSLYINNRGLKLVNPALLIDLTTDIFRGHQTIRSVRGETSGHTNATKLLSLRNVDMGIIDNNLESIETEGLNINEKYFLKDGDIIISAISTIKVALARIEGNEKVLPTGNLFVLRVDNNKVSPSYLAAFLQSKAGIELLGGALTGTAMKALNPSLLKNISIPVPNKDLQENIGSKYLDSLAALGQFNNKIKSISADLETIADNFIFTEGDE